MTDYDRDIDAGTMSGGRMVAAALVLVGVLLIIVTTIWAPVHIHDIFVGEQAGWPPYLQTIATLFAGWGLGLLFCGLAVVIRRTEDLLLALPENVNNSPARIAPGVAKRLDEHAVLLTELISLTRDVRDIELLSNSDRATRLRTEAKEATTRLEQEIPTLLREHRIDEAREQLRQARCRFPGLLEWDNLELRVEQARAQFEDHDLTVATREVDDLIALGAWDRAERIVRGLRQRHPSSEAVAELLRRVMAESANATAEERASLIDQAQQAGNRHDWSEALRIVEDLISRFPTSTEADVVRQQLPTIRDNAEIQTRRAMETEIRDLIQRADFVEALQVARDLIGRYPDSPQAAVLRDQLPRLKQRAAEGH